MPEEAQWPSEFDAKQRRILASYCVVSFFCNSYPQGEMDLALKIIFSRSDLAADLEAAYFSVGAESRRISKTDQRRADQELGTFSVSADSVN